MMNKIISQIMTGKAPLKKNNKRSLTYLVPMRHYFARPKRFGSRGPSENVRPFPTSLLRIRHRSELTERDWENALQGLGKSLTTVKSLSSQTPPFTRLEVGFQKSLRVVCRRFFYNCVLPWPPTLSFLFCPWFSFRVVTLRNRKEKYTEKSASYAGWNYV